MKHVPYLALSVLMTLVLGFSSPARPQNTGSIEGKIVDVDGHGVSNARIGIAGTPRSARPEPSGAFRFDAVPPGDYALEVFSQRFGLRAQKVSVSPGETTRVAIQIERLYHMDEIVVTAGSERGRSDTYQGINVLAYRDLAARAVASLGETLAEEPGVSSTSFGAGASRPVIRGLGGGRIRVLEAGVTTGDVSDTSPDHAVAVEPTSADRIEIVRGPATLLYGSDAVGGVVNVLDGRIPRKPLSRPIEGSFYGSGGTASNEIVGGGELRFGQGPIAVHLSGMRRESDDYDIPGFAELDHDEEEASHKDEEGHEEGPVEGTLPNSFVETTRGAAGVSYIGRSGYIGFSWSGMDSDYGVPGGHAEEGGGHGGEEETVTIDLDQRRLDLEGAWNGSGSVLRRAKARWGFSNYRHRELEGEEVGTTFDNEQWELRLEADHTLADRLSGTIGLQLGSRDFAAIGEEAFVPASDTDQISFFLFEEVEHGPGRYQLGIRYERQTTSTSAGQDLTHDGVSLSTGANWEVSETTTFAVGAVRSQKLPSPNELQSNGPHLATNAFEVGDPMLEPETALSLDASIRVRVERSRAELTWFVNRFSDFIFQDITGLEEDGLPVLRYGQTDAIFTGLESRADVEVYHRGEHHVALTGKLDWVRAERTDTDEALPRIPPVRIGGGIRYDGNLLRGILNVTRHTKQDRVAPNEEPTGGYTMVDASVSLLLFVETVANEITLRGTNLGNVEARNHVSLLKEQAPLPGRSVRLLYRLHF